MPTIPPSAKRVFKGEIFDVYQWKQKLFDNSFATFEMLERPDTVQIIAVQDSSFILAEEEQPHTGKFLSLLGGRVESGEQPVHAAQRELLEESGLASSDWELFDTFQPYNKIKWNVYTFIARSCKKIQEPTPDAGEKIALKTVSFDEFIKTITNTQFRSNLANLVLRMQLDNKLIQFKKKLMS